MNVDIWLAGTLNQFFMKGFYTQIKFSKKIKWLVVKLFVIDPFCTICIPNLSLLTLAFDRAVLFGSFAFSIVVLSTKKRYSIFLRKVFILKEICFRAKVIKMFKIFNEYFLLTFKMKPLRISVFLCQGHSQENNIFKENSNIGGKYEYQLFQSPCK